MHRLAKLFSSLIIVASLSACASTGSTTKTSAQINYAPAIDVPYSEVASNLKENVGVNVRWGGPIVATETVGHKTQLTVIARPLADNGQPIAGASGHFEGGRFIVEVDDFENSLIRRSVTVYGQVVGEKQLVNGHKTIAIPVITAIESKEWATTVARQRDTRNLAHHSFSGKHHSFGHGFSRFNRFKSFRGRGFKSRHSGFKGTRFGGHRSFGNKRFFGKKRFFGHRRH